MFNDNVLAAAPFLHPFLSQPAKQEPLLDRQPRDVPSLLTLSLNSDNNFEVIRTYIDGSARFVSQVGSCSTFIYQTDETRIDFHPPKTENSHTGEDLDL